MVSMRLKICCSRSSRKFKKIGRTEFDVRLRHNRLEKWKMLAEELLCKAAPWNERVQEILLMEEAKKATNWHQWPESKTFHSILRKDCISSYVKLSYKKNGLKKPLKSYSWEFSQYCKKNDCSVSHIKVDGNVKCRNKWKPVGSLWNRTNTPVAGLHNKSRFVSWYLASEKLLILAHALLPSACWVFARTAGWILWKWI